jgi:hypothetical protein
LRRGSEEPSRESCLALVGNHGEASASYLDRCKAEEKVARVFKKGGKNKRFLRKVRGKKKNPSRRAAFTCQAPLAG